MSKATIDFFNQKLIPHAFSRKKGDREADLQKNTVQRPAPVTFRDRFIRSGSPAFDVDRYIDSEFGEKLMEHFENYAPYEDEMDPRVLAYWEARGLRKTMHNGEDDMHKWTSFVPLEAEENPELRFPVIFCIHGNSTPIFMVETYGYCHLAAKEKCIVIMPTEAEDGFEDLYDQVMREFPVDPTRVYIIGFSYGGYVVNKYGITMNDKFAAGCSGGVLYNGFEGNNGYRIMRFTEEQRQNAYEKHFPIIFITGQQESNLFLPYNKQKDEVTNLRDKVFGTIFWRKVNGCETPTFEEAKEVDYTNANTVECILGTRCDNTYVKVLDGVLYYFGEVVSEDGITRLVHVGIENGPHVAAPSFAQVSWDFMKHFSRDPETGESVYTP